MMSKSPPTLGRLLHSRLLLWLLMLCIATLTFAGTFLYLNRKNDFEREGRILASTLARYSDLYVTAALHHLEQAAENLPSTPHSSHLRTMLFDSAAGRHFARVMVIDSTRKVLASVPDGPTAVDFPILAGQSDFSGRILGKPAPLADTGEVVIYLGVPLQQGGMLVGALRLSELQQHVRELLPPSEGVVLITDRYGNLIAHPDDRLVQQQGNIGNLPAFQKDRIRDTTSLELNGETWLSSTSVVTPSGWVIFTLKRQAALVQEVLQGITLFLLLLGAIYTLFAVSLLLELQWRVGKPLERFTESIQYVAKGWYDRLPDEGQSFAEIETMREEFHLMAARVRDREAALRHARGYVRDIIDAIPSSLFALDMQGRITQMNRAAHTRINETAEAVGRPVRELLPELLFLDDEIRSSITHQKMLVRERIATLNEGRYRYEDIAVFPLVSEGPGGAVLRLDNVTERVRIEELMVQSEKMLSVGGLAAGMAHEINNPLGAILQGAQNIQRRLSAELPANAETAQRLGTTLDTVNAYLHERKILTFLEGIREAGSRASAIVSNMLEFSRRSSTQRSTMNLHEALDKAVSLAVNDYDLQKKYDFRQIEIVRDYAQALPPVVCSATEIEQVVLNLLRNAAQALSQHSGGVLPPRIILRTRLEGGRIRLDVEDNGPGMAPEVRKRVFEPFFTTKDVGVGTGLGLSVSYFIITRNHGGSFDVVSSLGKGTTFTIHLPLPDTEAREALLPQPELPPPANG